MSACCLIRSLKAVPCPCPELELVRKRIGLVEALAVSRRAVILRELYVVLFQLMIVILDFDALIFIEDGLFWRGGWRFRRDCGAIGAR